MLNNKQEEKLSVLCRRAFESLVGQIIVDEEGKILYFSKEHERFTGIDKEYALGRYVEDVLPNTRMHVVLKTGIPEIGNIFEMKNYKTGQIKLMVCNRIPIRDENGKIVGAMAETIFSKGISDINRLGTEINKISDATTFTTARDYYKDVYSNEEFTIKVNHEDNNNNIKGRSPQIMQLKQVVAKIANTSIPVLISGETGTGKEVFAEALHLSSDTRRNKNYVKINCAAIPGELLESELFGYEKGAFSGANNTGKIGKFEYAGAGTVLLDEIGDMPMHLQSKLLRVLQEKCFERVGGLKSIPFNARFICTTNKDLEKLIKEDKFREDLYYRINVMEMYIPPLREHKEDIEDLSKTFIDDINSDYELSIEGLSNDALSMLKGYNWPGNVRELRHVIERACMMKGSGIIDSEDLQFIRINTNVGRRINTNDGLNLKHARAKAEMETIIRALETTKGNKKKAAEMLGIDRSVLYDKLKEYQIKQ